MNAPMARVPRIDVILALRSGQPMTSRGMAARYGFCRFQLQRTLSQLVEDDLIEEKSVDGGRSQVTYRLTGNGAAAADFYDKTKGVNQ